MFETYHGKFEKEFVFFYYRKDTNRVFLFKHMYRYIARGIGSTGHLIYYIKSKDIVLTGHEMMKYALLKDNAGDPGNYKSTLRDYFSNRKAFFKELA